MGERKFELAPAVRSVVPVIVGLSSPSGGGKTYSALRLATGMQSIVGGEIAMVDTENRRGIHYADSFKYQHVDFKPPFGSRDYLAAIRHCAENGAKIIIVDSMTHEHDGEGGLLEQHEVEWERLGHQENTKFMAWQKPKAGRRALLNGCLQIDAHFIWCFRAKKMVKPVKKDGRTKFEEQGFMPICGDEFPFETTVSVVLPPAGEGTPIWLSEYAGEKMYMKLPMQFKALFAEKKQLDESIGKALAEWAQGGEKPTAATKHTGELGDLGQADETISKALGERVQGGEKPTGQTKHMGELGDLERPELLEEIRATFKKNDMAGRSKEVTAERNAILRDHFLTDKWSVIQKMEAEKLRDGLASMQAYFRGDDMPERGEGAEMF